MLNPLDPVTLEGSIIRLEPAHERHVHGLFEVGADDAIWKAMIGPIRTTIPDFEDLVRRMIAGRDAGEQNPFVVVEKASDRVIGSTRLYDFSPVHMHIEIGHTWYAKEQRGTKVNPESKFLLLRHCFETCGLTRVQIKTNEKNAVSRAAILKLGASFEGILRKHMRLADGTMRNTAMYSITDDDWPMVMERLLERLAE